ncbi:MAG: shikimate kinase [Promethearchaeota archaeon]
MKSNIALVGFMGTGKTATGEIVAKKLGKQFIEADELIAQRAGMSIPEIFSKHGEIRFRELEIEVAREMGTMREGVFSMGGGVIMNQISIMYLRENCVIIRLSADAATIFARVMAEGKEKRPMIAKPDPKGEIERLLAFREPFYNAATDLFVDTTGKMIDEVADEIIKIYNDNKD